MAMPPSHAEMELRGPVSREGGEQRRAAVVRDQGAQMQLTKKLPCNKDSLLPLQAGLHSLPWGSMNHPAFLPVIFIEIHTSSMELPLIGDGDYSVPFSCVQIFPHKLSKKKGCHYLLSS